jgi:hypothetical protein
MWTWMNPFASQCFPSDGDLMRGFSAVVSVCVMVRCADGMWDVKMTWPLPCHLAISCTFRPSGSQSPTPAHRPCPHQCSQHPWGLQSYHPGIPRAGTSLGGRGKTDPSTSPGFGGTRDGKMRCCLWARLNTSEVLLHMKIPWWVLEVAWQPLPHPCYVFRPWRSH